MSKNSNNANTFVHKGSKGFVTIEILKQIEKDSGKPIHELFDYIIGVSTGAVLATLVGILKLPLTEVERLYSQCTEALFNRSMTTGIQNLLKSYSYYDTQMWESVLQNIIGDIKLINSAREINAPKVSYFTSHYLLLLNSSNRLFWNFNRSVL
jgi:patatin-like phospholipase/acyl hydrolase